MGRGREQGQGRARGRCGWAADGAASRCLHSLPHRPHPQPHPLQPPRRRPPVFVLGAAVLLPWNLILSSLPFFASLLAPSSALHASLPSTLSFVATGTNFLALAWITFCAGRAAPRELGEPTGNGAGVVGRIRQSLLGLLLAFACVQAFVILAPAEGQAGPATVVVLGAWVVGVMLGGSYLQAAVISYASCVPAPFTAQLTVLPAVPARNDG